MEKYEVWIEAEEWEPGELNPADDNTDVVVTFDEGSQWEATFITYANIATLAERNKHNGACLSGSYFWARDLILIEEISRPGIEAVVARMLETGDFYDAFGCYGEDKVC